MLSTAVSACFSTVTLSIVALSHANKIMNLKHRFMKRAYHNPLRTGDRGIQGFHLETEAGLHLLRCKFRTIPTLRLLQQHRCNNRCAREYAYCLSRRI